ncbi:MAG TPA: ABC transporter permease, partial [Gammaproteobacteria bacterium]|nr:ABC transporter permease [Gammaproteobacteria bacterium]
MAATVVLTLALGIGTTTAVYSIIDAAFFRPLPFHDAKHLVVLRNVEVPLDPHLYKTPPRKTRLDINDLDALRGVFPSAGAYATGELNLGSGSQPLRVEATFVTTGFFETLQSRAMLGRVFTGEETSSGGPSAVVLSNGLWRSQFGGDPSVIGRNIILDGRSYAVVGVMPATFRFPAEAQVWLPLPVPAPLAILSAFRNTLPSVVVARV